MSPPGAAPRARPATLADGTVLRPLAERREQEACVELQRRVWGEDFSDVTAPAILAIVQQVGGVAAGAFDGERLVGFVFGVTGLRGGGPVHWSHMLAVHPDARGRDLGFHLKCYQRCLLLDLGVERVLWTYDPLMAQNAYLNLVRLGARPVRYVRDYYGEGSDSTLAAGLGTDRFVVEWRLACEAVERAIREGGAEERLTGRRVELRAAPVANLRPGTGGEPEPVVSDPPEDPVVRVAIPSNVLAVREASEARAGCWRASTRRALESLLARGYRVAGFLRPHGDPADHPSYVLERPGEAGQRTLPAGEDPSP
ncbi:MAG: hypothetical protein ACLF0P_02175 [Thermoanaerobaculia bacterium]